MSVEDVKKFGKGIKQYGKNFNKINKANISNKYAFNYYLKYKGIIAKSSTRTIGRILLFVEKEQRRNPSKTIEQCKTESSGGGGGQTKQKWPKWREWIEWNDWRGKWPIWECRIWGQGTGNG